ncbi:MAG: phosphatidylglycerophosphatase A [Elusimicrobiota bacterium]|nr:phosphatidylglycerophosphatase A [Elusimicrobiota bacterium]
MRDKSEKLSFIDKTTLTAATGFFISYLPRKIIHYKKNTGAGWLGTLVALACVPLLPVSNLNFAVFLSAFFLFSIWIAQKASAIYKTQDDPRIVIDEIIGYWVAIAFLPRTLPFLITAFILFRVLDTLKPWPINFFEKKFNGGFGIIMDDVVAGMEVNLIIVLFIKLFI